MARISFLSCVFLIGLRLVIGWHFFFEGVHKYESTRNGESEIAKPFSSAGYFTEAEGPLGPSMREQIGDADTQALARLKLAGSPDDKPSARMPVALASEWDDYARQLEAYYKLNDEDKQRIAETLEKAKNDYVWWLTDKKPRQEGDEKKKADEPKKITKTIVSVGSSVEYEFADNVEQRVLEYQFKLREIRDIYEDKLRRMGKDVEKTRLRTLKSQAASMRVSLMKDMDEHTSKLKEALAKSIGDRLSGFNVGNSQDPAIDERVLAMLTLASDGDDVSAARMPVALDKQWRDYFDFVREHGQESLRHDPQRGEQMLDDAKLRYVRYLLDRDQFTGDVLPDHEVSDRVKAYRQAIVKLRAAEKALNDVQPREAESSPKDKQPKAAKTPELIAKEKAKEAASLEVARLRQTFVDDIRRHTDILRQNLGGFTNNKAKDFDNFKGTIAPEKERMRFLWHEWPTSKLEWLDWSTRWGLLIAGGCVLLGLFTRLACLGCVAFLVIEYLSNSPFPWLPVSPKAEGNYVFVNKNVVELMALLVLATLPTGRWFGLDAILSRVWPFYCLRR